MTPAVALETIVELLACPRCAEPMRLADATLRCASGHAFDVARQGYVNLSGSSPPRNADTAAMVAARDRFLAAGCFTPVAEVLARVAGARSPRTVLDCGAGTGFYLRRLLTDLPDARGVALDVSVPAARRAARAHPRIGAVVADAWRRLPLADHCLDAVISVFAPRHRCEFHRVLHQTGRLVTVSPLPEHLAEIRGPLGLLDIPADKPDRLATGLAGWFAEVHREEVTTLNSWPRAVIADLVAMGPNAFHLDPATITARVARLPEAVAVTVSVSVSRWSPRQ